VQNTYLQEEIRSEHNFGEIVGHSSGVAGSCWQQVDQVAPRRFHCTYHRPKRATGKGTRRASHSRPQRAQEMAPLVKVNCGAISAGPRRERVVRPCEGPRFTGRSDESRRDVFKVADGGTIFLDEVGELPMETQVKLLARVAGAGVRADWQQQDHQRSTSAVIAATQPRTLNEAVSEGKFRRDLFYLPAECFSPLAVPGRCVSVPRDIPAAGDVLFAEIRQEASAAREASPPRTRCAALAAYRLAGERSRTPERDRARHPALIRQHGLTPRARIFGAGC